MNEKFKFITGDNQHNMTEIDRLTAELEKRYAGCSVNISHEVNTVRARLRFSLSPLHDRGTHENQRDDYHLATVDVPANKDLGDEVVLREADEALKSYWNNEEGRL